MTVKQPEDTREAVERIVAHLAAGGQEEQDGVEVRRAGRGDLATIAALVNRASEPQPGPDEAGVMEWLFSKGLWVAIVAGELVGVAAWQAENLLCVTDVFFVHPTELLAAAGGGLMSTIESQADTLMCEANVVVVPAGTGEAVRACLAEQGYELKTYGELHRIWREVLNDFVDDGPDLLVKRLRERMVMVPI